MGAWEDPKTGEVTLFAVNHHKEGERVEVFRHNGSKPSKTLRHVKTIRDPKMPHLNDIVATGPDSFYGTQFFTLSLAADFFMMYPGGGVVYYDGEKISPVLTGLWMANGINISPDRQYLYVVDAWQDLRTYKIQSDDVIQEVQVYKSGTCLDNIHVDRGTGDLWVGAYSNGLKMALHLSGSKGPAYSQVLRLKVDEGRIADVREIYANDGSEISGSSIAIPYKTKLFIGSMLNMFQKVFNHAPGPCRQLNNVKHGAEDAYLLSNGLLFISSGFGRPSGKMLRLDLGASDSDTEEFVIEGNFDASTFATHGIGAWEDPKTGEVTLFAVNHHKDGERVEVFRHDGTKTSKTLRYVKTIQGPQIPYLNDIVATGPNSFYGTHMFTWGMREDFLLMYAGGHIIHYDGEKALVVATGLTLANGINMSPDKRSLYVAESRGNIRTYEIQNDKTLRELQVYDTGSSPDNIYVDPDSGDLWLGCHPNTYKTTLYVSSLGKNYNTYSQVLRLKVDMGKITDAREVYANDGSEIKGSTIAIPYKKNLFIGTIADRAVVCDLVYSG